MERAFAQRVLQTSAARAADYLEALPGRRVAPRAAAVAALKAFDHPLPEQGLAPDEVLARLDGIGSPATVASAGPRYFGLVVGGALPAAIGAAWLAAAWDQNACFRWTSPVAATLEEVALGWVTELLGLPAAAGGAFVTGASMANFTALAAARHALLARAGWDVEAHGLYGAPQLQIVVSEQAHVTLMKALALLGLGRERVLRVPTDRQGRLRAERLPPLDERTIVCLQAGNVNTGAFDPIAEVCAQATAAGAWAHVDGAFGLWARASPQLAPLAAGVEAADSWAVDGHKWLNTPYDGGLALVRRPADLQAAMATGAAYLGGDAAGDRQPADYTPESSRRARGVEVWAALLSLGRKGLADLVERCCRHARTFARGLEAAGYEILNEVVLNQVLVAFGPDEATRGAIARVQADGVCWCGATEWQGRTAMRISVANWSTTDEDVRLSLESILRAAASSGAA